MSNWRSSAVTADIAQAFLKAIQAAKMQPEAEIDGRTIAEWMVWAEHRLEELDPLKQWSREHFTTLAGINGWSS
ncbi:hypothetical protein IHQ71_02150 [Rhizobium sp. TH2]|uniref:hypothetical protein n=1 Tax=Rhizobium sp. TH2 TaxID=2775403 RepID=UPI002157E755|nr:hypothetical protein [Rhizobium sp. TH2]UVC09452.1 hypothetical protein IHQ71_02150 [Rhizobium sp. TH2]